MEKRREEERREGGEREEEGRGVSVCVINIIMPHTDPTGSWRQLVFLGFMEHDQVPSPTGDPPRSPQAAQNPAVAVELPNLLYPMLPEEKEGEKKEERTKERTKEKYILTWS